MIQVVEMLVIISSFYDNIISGCWDGIGLEWENRVTAENSKAILKNHK